ncbi:flagellar biosynthetic protein FliO [Planococcus shixiaomingii]|uniref:flagellar biosynthetic protein FliO n=1 Tax=Planococcus shixiaomingii TaxID=3058393 RepID=UPI00261A25B2|nr:flagellar biosynthetic protein FliO [Planococcus sp. N022]WKA53904.1 flagellar biosynthetic protein FliO [Planococcus sp. N022]
MSRKKIIYVMIILFTLSFIALSGPMLAQAEDTNVSDWVKDEKPDENETEQPIEPVVTEDKSLTVIIGKLILYTLLILVMIYGLIKFLAMRQKKFQPNQAVKLMGGTPLGNNKSLQLVKVGSQVYMIGVGDQVTLIKEFTDADEIKGIEKDLDNQPTLMSNPVVSFVKEKVNNRTKTGKTSGFEQLFSQSLTKQKLKQEQVAKDLNKNDKEEGSSS